jgi:putative multiple sugar transport system permease protein
MNTNKNQALKGNMRQYSMVIALGLLIVLFYFLTDGMLLKPLNITNLILQNGYILILAIGMLPVIITARIDLSVGSIVAFVGAVAAIMIVNLKVGFIPTILVCLAVGALIGAWQGFWTAFVNIPAFITTLSSMLVFRGLTIAILDGRSIGPFTDTFRAISSSFIPDFFGGMTLFGTKLDLTALAVGLLMCVYLVIRDIGKRRATKKYAFETTPLWFFVTRQVIVCVATMVFFYFLAAYNGIPSLLILLVVLVMIYSFITSRTVIGRRIYALGGNEVAARLSGINTRRLVFATNINMGVLAAVAGIVFAARLNAGTPKAGNGFELDAIAACFIGGASVYGGTGTIMGAILGTFIMGIMNNGMSIMGISIDYQQAIKGLVVLFAVAIDMAAKNKQK